MYDILLTDDPSHWPWHAFVNLPLIPISLLVSRTTLFEKFLLPATPLLLAWTTSSPVPRPFSKHFTHNVLSPTRLASSIPSFPRNLFPYPPSPLLTIMLVPVLRAAYYGSFNHLRNWVLGTKPSLRMPAQRVVWDLGRIQLPLRIRVVAEVANSNNDDREAIVNNAGQPGLNPNADANADTEEDPDNANALAAERAIDVTHLSLGRALLESLAIPWIASHAGRALTRLSVYSPLLQRVLAIKQPQWHGGAILPPLGAASYPAFWEGMNEVRRMWAAMKVGLGLAWGGSATWAESDPVWLVTSSIRISFWKARTDRALSTGIGGVTGWDWGCTSSRKTSSSCTTSG